MKLPDKRGYFGEFGGRFVPEVLFKALKELEQAYLQAKRDKNFIREFNFYLKEYAGRPTPLYFASNLSKHLKMKVYLKREDLLHTGAHKINNTLGQILLALRMGKRRIVAETGAGQHGVAVATVCALFGIECVIYMGSLDYKRQSLNVFRMKLLGAQVIKVDKGTKTLKDACNEAIRDWITNIRTTYYLLGSVVGPHPYPLMVRDFQSVIGKETKTQILRKEGKLPHCILACVGGGSNAIGIFYPFYKYKRVKFIGVEAAGLGLSTYFHAASLCKGKVGILHGAKSYVLQDKDGQIQTTHSVAPGLDYPGVGPEHAFYKKTKRALYVGVSDKEALAGFKMLSKYEGIIPALESAHAVFYLTKIKKDFKNKIVVVCLSGRGDKDINIVKKSIKL